MAATRPLQIIETADDPASAARAAFRVIPGGLADEAIAGAGIDTAVASEGGALIVLGLSAVTWGLLLAAMLCTAIGIVMFYRQLRSFVGYIPFGVGGAMQFALDIDYRVLSPILHSLEDQCYVQWQTMVEAFRNLIIGLLTNGPFPTKTQTRAAIAAVTAPLLSSVGALDTWTRSTVALNAEAIRRLSGQAHALWSRLTSLELQQKADEAVLVAHAKAISAVQQAQIALAYELTALKSEIVRDERIIQAQGRQIQSLNRAVSVLQSELASLTGRVYADERAMAPAIEVAVVGAVLGPLIAAGPAAIEELARLGRNPCRCFQIPGSEGWVQKAMVAKLWWDSEP